MWVWHLSKLIHKSKLDALFLFSLTSFCLKNKLKPIILIHWFNVRLTKSQQKCKHCKPQTRSEKHKSQWRLAVSKVVSRTHLIISKLIHLIILLISINHWWGLCQHINPLETPTKMLIKILLLTKHQQNYKVFNDMISFTQALMMIASKILDKGKQI